MTFWICQNRPALNAGGSVDKRRELSCAPNTIVVLYPSLCSNSKLHTRKINFFSLVAQYTILKLRKIKFILPDQNENNNHTSKIKIFPVSHTFFFHEGVKK